MFRGKDQVLKWQTWNHSCLSKEPLSL